MIVGRPYTVDKKTSLGESKTILFCKLLYNESNNTTLGGMIRLDEQRE
jgi:hypothetical protein